MVHGIVCLFDPVNLIDPLGLLVDITFNKATGTLRVKDRDTGVSITASAESGGKPFGDPIPSGKYDILDQAQNSGFFRLDAVDENPRNDTHDNSGRKYFRLHGPGATIGCIAVKDQNKWYEIKDLINNTDTTITTDNSVSWLKFWAKPITKYGDINVINNPCAQ